MRQTDSFFSWDVINFTGEQHTVVSKAISIGAICLVSNNLDATHVTNRRRDCSRQTNSIRSCQGCERTELFESTWIISRETQIFQHQPCDLLTTIKSDAGLFTVVSVAKPCWAHLVQGLAINNLRKHKPFLIVV